MSSERSGPLLNSAYYRERFGSQSPEEYKSLRLTNMDPKVSGDELRVTLEKVFGRYGDMTCKIVRQNEPTERIAYINFDHPADAREARLHAGPKIMAHFGRKVRCDPANVFRDQGGRVLTRQQNDPFKSSYARSNSPPPRFYDNAGGRSTYGPPSTRVSRRKV